MQVKEMNHLKSENINELKYEHALIKIINSFEFSNRLTIEHQQALV